MMFIYVRNEKVTYIFHKNRLEKIPNFRQKSAKNGC